MKKLIHFSKAFVPCVIFSILFIVAGLITVCTKGINFGLDFKPGLIQEVRLVPPAVSLTYNGSATVSVETSSNGVTVVVSGIGAENSTFNYYYGQYPTVAELVSGINLIEGVKATALVSGSNSSLGMFTNSELSSVLTSKPYNLYQESESLADVEEVRAVLAGVNDISIKATGAGTQLSFQIRAGDNGSDPEMRNLRKQQILNLLGERFGAENVSVLKTDYIGSNFSKSLVKGSVILVLATLLLIWGYATIRFKWDLALGAVLAIIHDALIMVSFVAFTQMEFSSVTIAAILTIIGYSINDTIVVLDRVRENIKVTNIRSFKELWDYSQSSMLTRTIITTVTTLLAVLSLYVFTTGSMKDFALAMIVGLVSGVYSTIFIAGSFSVACRKNWKPEDEIKQQVTLNA